MVQAMPLGLLIEDEAGGGWINAELARIWGRPSDMPAPASELRRDLQAPAGQERSEHLVRAAFGNTVGAGRWRHHALRRGDGTTVPVRVLRQPLPGPAGDVLTATYVMETSPPEPDARLRKAFLAMVGHELRTPISSIVAGIELLQGSRLDDGTRDEVTALVVEEAHRVNILVEQVTALTLLHSLGTVAATEPVHVVHLVRKVGLRETRRRPRLRLRLPSIESRACIALGDEGFVAQVLEILIDNAAKYAAPGEEVEVAVERAADEVAIHVLDRGPGLQGADPVRLFELFERAEAHAGDGRGTGIGLYVAGRIVAAMHGRVWACDRPAGGADFGFALPAAT